MFRYEVTRIRPEYMRDVMPPKVAQREDLGDPVHLGAAVKVTPKELWKGQVHGWPCSGPRS